MFGRGMIKKVIMYLFLGPLALLIGGSFNIMDFLMIPMVADMLKPMFGSMGLNLGGAPAAAGATT